MEPPALLFSPSPIRTLWGTTLTKLALDKTSGLSYTLSITRRTRINQLIELTLPHFSRSIEYNALFLNISFADRTILILHILRLKSPHNVLLANKAIWHSAVVDASMSEYAIRKWRRPKAADVASPQHSPCVTIRKISSVSAVIALSKKRNAVSHKSIIDKTMQDYI